MQPRSNTPRIVLAGILLYSLFLLAIAYGTVGHAPADNSHADENEWANDPRTYLGERVTAGGIVVSTDPHIIEVGYGVDETTRVAIENVESDVKVGQELHAFGTLTDDRTISAERTHHRYQWEVWYMYAVSLLGGLWVAGRFLIQWTVDWAAFVFQPRRDYNE